MILKNLGLELTVTERPSRPKTDFIAMASTSASVSFKETLPDDELIHILLTGKVPANRRPHMRALLNEASPAMLHGLLEEVSRWTKPGRAEKNFAAIAKALGTTRKIAGWMKQD